MGKYRTPGVTFESADLPRQVISPVRSDVAGFVGVAQTGPLNRPRKIESWQQFLSQFGGFMQEAFLAYAVQGFFNNGGRTCYVVRVGDPKLAVFASRDLSNTANEPTLRLTARKDGPVGERIQVRVSWSTSMGRPPQPERFTLMLSTDGSAPEVWPNLTLEDANDDRYAVRVLNDKLTGSWLVCLKDLGALNRPRRPAATDSHRSGPVMLKLPSAPVILAGLKPWQFSGEDARAPLPGDPNKWGLRALEDVPEVSLVASPDVVWRSADTITQPTPTVRCDAPPSPTMPTVRPQTQDVRAQFSDDDVANLRGALMRHCEKLGDRFALIDTDLVEPDKAIQQAASPRTSYAALYYPWVYVADDLQGDGAVRAVPPSGHVAGVCARVDLAIGVQKPPANETLNGVQGVTRALTEPTLGDLNEGRVNVIRALPGRGVRVYGARTLARDEESDWLYVNVRRLLLMIETAINTQTQWAVFEPNTLAQRRAVARVVTVFLDHLWRQGYLDGASAGQAYSVVCDDTTNPSQDVDLGKLTCQVRLMAPAPAEFVTVRIGKNDGTQAAANLPEGTDV